VTDDWQMLIARAAAEKVEYIAAHRERLIEAWVAETGLMPSESVLCINERREGDGVTMRCWVERRTEADRREAAALTDDAPECSICRRRHGT